MSTPISRLEETLIADKKKAEAARNEAKRKWEEARDALRNQRNKLKDAERSRKEANVKELKAEYDEEKTICNAKDKALDELQKKLITNARKENSGKNTALVSEKNHVKQQRRL